jgi:hypothetical protein
MKTKCHLLAGWLAVLIGVLACAGCGGGVVSILTIPDDYKLQTADVSPQGMGDLTATNIRDYERSTGVRLVVVQLKYKSPTPLRCFDERGNKVPFVGSLIQVDTGARSALMVREMQVMGDDTLVAYVFAVPVGARTISIAGHGQQDLAKLLSGLPPISPEEMKINFVVSERN